MPSDAKIVDGPNELMPKGGRRRFSYAVEQGGAIRRAVVEIPVALMESSPTSDIGALIIATKGRSALERQLAQGRVPKQLTVQYMEHSFGEGLSSN